MTTAVQVKSLVRSHMKGDHERFLTVAAQIAASEASKGRATIAADIRRLIQTPVAGGLVPLSPLKGDVAELLSVSQPETQLSDMVLPDGAMAKIRKVLNEQAKADLLYSRGLNPRSRLLLTGPPGTGKTMTAAAIAGELELPLFLVRYESLIDSLLGKTASKLSAVFEVMASTPGIYFFDEFDAIGTQRTNGRNDVGEIRRILNSCLQFLEQNQGRSLVIGATNHPEMLDKALYRRFDDIIEYELPTPEAAADLANSLLNGFGFPHLASLSSTGFATAIEGLSQSEISLAVKDAVKEAVMAGSESVSYFSLVEHLKARKSLLGG